MEVNGACFDDCEATVAIHCNLPVGGCDGLVVRSCQVGPVTRNAHIDRDRQTIVHNARRSPPPKQETHPSTSTEVSHQNLLAHLPLTFPRVALFSPVACRSASPPGRDVGQRGWD